jgi:uncharacterized protein YjbI with pentapeptide repeats
LTDVGLTDVGLTDVGLTDVGLTDVGLTATAFAAAELSAVALAGADLVGAAFGAVFAEGLAGAAFFAEGLAGAAFAAGDLEAVDLAGTAFAGAVAVAVPVVVVLVREAFGALVRARVPDALAGVVSASALVDVPLIAVSASVPPPGVVADAPLSDAPPSDAPLSDTPLSDAPLSDAPLSDAPLSDAPPFDAPATDASLSDTPPPDAPSSELLPADVPASEAGPAALGIDPGSATAVSPVCQAGVCRAVVDVAAVERLDDPGLTSARADRVLLALGPDAAAVAFFAFVRRDVDGTRTLVSEPVEVRARMLAVVVFRVPEVAAATRSRTALRTAVRRTTARMAARAALATSVRCAPCGPVSAAGLSSKPSFTSGRSAAEAGAKRPLPRRTDPGAACSSTGTLAPARPEVTAPGPDAGAVRPLLRRTGAASGTGGCCMAGGFGADLRASGCLAARRGVAVVWFRVDRSSAAIRGAAEPFVAFAITKARVPRHDARHRRFASTPPIRSRFGLSGPPPGRTRRPNYPTGEWSSVSIPTTARATRRGTSIWAT